MPAKKTTKTVKKPAKLGSKKKESFSCKLEVSFNDSTYKGEANSLREALESFAQSSLLNEFVKTPVLVDIIENGVAKHSVLPVGRARVLFRQIAIKPIAIEFLAKNIENRLR